MEEGLQLAKPISPCLSPPIWAFLSTYIYAAPFQDEGETARLCPLLAILTSKCLQLPKVRALHPSSPQMREACRLTANDPTGLDSTLNKLSINSQPAKAPAASKKKEVAESWEDEDSGDDTDVPNSALQPNSFPSAPPPTPISPSISSSDRDTFVNPYGYGGGSSSSLSPSTTRAGARPEKTDAVAKRLIAGALGVRPPKMTEEQRAYDRAVKEKEIKRRNLEKEAAAKAEEDAAKAKAAAWND